MKGSCLCGAVGFEVDEQVARAIDRTSVCHCGQCRKQSGHVWASAVVPQSAVRIAGEPVWYEASPVAKRGFCPTCGSFLFWKANDEDTMSVSLGSIDGPTGLRLAHHIFVADKGDYYEIADGLPQS